MCRRFRKGKKGAKAWEPDPEPEKEPEPEPEPVVVVDVGEAPAPATDDAEWGAFGGGKKVKYVLDPFDSFSDILHPEVESKC